MKTSVQRALAAAAGLGATAACLAGAPLAAQKAAASAGPSASPTEPELLLGPVRGFTSGWHPAPQATLVPLGTTLELRVELPPGAAPAEPAWAGAVGPGGGPGHVVCAVEGVGAHLVQVSCPTAAGLWQAEALFVGAPVAPADVQVLRPRFSVPPLAVGRDADPELLNFLSMHDFFGESVAQLVELAPSHWATSVRRTVEMRPRTNPPGFEGLMEWRVDGEPAGVGAYEQTFLERGLHAVEVGPPGRSAAGLIETYEVEIAHAVWSSSALTGTRGVLTARTDPPGFEEQVRWLASTKYGTAEPLQGEGRVFQVRFSEVMGPEGRVWVGVKADAAPLGQDQKPTLASLAAKLKAAAQPAKSLATQLVESFGSLSQADVKQEACEIRELAQSMKEPVGAYLNLVAFQKAAAAGQKSAACDDDPPTPECLAACALHLAKCVAEEEGEEAQQAICELVAEADELKQRACQGLATLADAQALEVAACAALDEVCELPTD